MSDVTCILSAVAAGDPHAATQLLPLVYDELRRLAAQKLAHEKPGQTLEATALVHEAYLRLVGDFAFADRRHFFRVAAEAMRQILIDRARRKQRARHGGDRQRVPLSDVEAAAESTSEQLMAIDEALDLEALYLAVRKRLYDIPRHRFGLSADRAEDVLHDAWLLFLQKRGIIREAAPWLAGTVANLARQQLDKKKRRKESSEDELGEMHDPRHTNVIDRVAISAALDRVDERTRQLCVLIGIEGLSYDEVSAATNLPLGSIGPLYIRAKKKLRTMLEN